MRNIEDIATDIERANYILTKEIETIPLGQRPAYHMQMAAATEQLPLLLEEMKNVVIPSRLIGLFVSGDATAIGKVSALLVKNEGLVLDAGQMYREIADLVEPSFSNDRTFTTTQYSLFVQGVRKIGENLGYLQIEAPKYRETTCPTSASTIAHIRSMLKECKVGDQANLELLTNSAIDAIVRNKIDSKQIPVMVIGCASTEERNAIATMFARSADFELPAGFEPTVQKIVSMFKAQKQSAEEPKTDED